MAISFEKIPNSLELPGFFGELDASKMQAGYTSGIETHAIIAQMIPDGTATADTRYPVTSKGQADALFGKGSIAARMVERLLAQYPLASLYVVPLADKAGSTAATGRIDIAGTATGAGTWNIRLGRKEPVQVGVAVGDTVAEQAIAVRAAINTYGTSVTNGQSLTVGKFYEIVTRSTYAFTTAGAADNNPGTVFQATVAGTLGSGDEARPITNAYPVVAQVVPGGANPERVTLRAKNKGTLGNALPISVNFYGDTEADPAGSTATVTAMSSGATDPEIDNAIAAIGDEEYFAVLCPLCDATSLDDLKTEMESRWGYLNRQYGMVWSAKYDSYTDLATFAANRNNEFETLCGVPETEPMCAEEYLAELAGVCLPSLENDPAMPLQTLELPNAGGAASASRFTPTERNALLAYGISTAAVDKTGATRIDAMVTTYLTNDAGADDAAFHHLNTMYTLRYIYRRHESLLQSQFGRMKLRDDGAVSRAGSTITTPRDIKAALAMDTVEMDRLGIVENASTIIGGITVERVTGYPNRVAILYPPDLVNQLRQKFYKLQPRLQY